MSDSYNPGQQWTHNQVNFDNLQLEQELEYNAFTVGGGVRQQHQQQHQQQNQQQNQQQTMQPPYGSRNAYQFSQQQVPPNPSGNVHSSSLHGAFTMPTNQQQSQSRSSSYGTTQNTSGGFAHGVYPQQKQTPGHDPVANHYRTAPTTFNFSSASSSSPMGMSGIETGQPVVPSNFTTSPGPLHQTFSPPTTQHQSIYGVPPKNDPQLPHSKRQRNHTFHEDSFEDAEADASSNEQKDANKAKLSRACQRCKNLKVRCESKTETDPCKRCLNGGHDCVIPGRKIRRTPPKREHLLNQIHTQTKEIERLMVLLEKATTTSSKPQHSTDDAPSSTHLQSPVLSPESTSGSYFGSETLHSHSITDETANITDNKAVEEWIAKARESFDHFGALVGIGGAGMSQSYIIDEDFEGSGNSSGDDDSFLDAQEDIDGLGNPDDRYELAVEHPEDEEMAFQQGSSRAVLHHKSSASSLGTTGTTSGRPRKKNSGESRPANLPVAASPFGMFGNLSLKNPRSRESSAERDEEDKGPGIANEDFFKSTPAGNELGRRLANAQHQAPHILTRGVVTPQEAEHLFQIYFDKMNMSVSLLDPVLYTAQRTFYRSPFLFTVVCAIASRFYSERPGLYPQAMHYAQLAAGTALISGNKNVEMCQAYILLSLYPVPAKKWEDQRSWLYLGLAIRAATDLNLHLPATAKPLNENHAREMLNRTRVWMNCLNLDRSTGSQYGKPPIISPKDYIANHSENWWQSSPYNMKNFDIQICAYNSELKIMAGFVAKIYSDPDHPTGLNKEVDFEKIATETDDELKALQERWFSVLEQTDMSDPQNCFRTGLLRLAYSYSRLIALSYGFQHAFGKNAGTDENPFLIRCLQAASDVVDAVVNDICRPSQLHYFRHGPEAQSVFVTFASAFLVKLLQPKFASYLTPETRVNIRGLVQKVIDLLGSPEVAIDERHGPKLYSRFLEKLLAKPMARLDPMSPGATSTTPLPRAKSRRPRSAGQPTDYASPSFEIPSTVYNHPSPSTSTSLSPPPTEAALSFDSFAPVGPVDPFASETAATTAAVIAGASTLSHPSMGDFFQPPLPFDDDIMSSMQSLTDPTGWQDISLPGFNWMAQFQQNLGLDLNDPTALYEPNMPYMTGPAK